MEDYFAQSFREMIELRGYLQPPFTEEEQRELHRIFNSCDCQPNGNNHADDCILMLGLFTFAKERKQQS